MWDGSKDMGHGLRTGQVQVTGVDGQPEGVGWRSLGGGTSIARLPQALRERR